jgi:hypothetical protein
MSTLAGIELRILPRISAKTSSTVIFYPFVRL